MTTRRTDTSTELEAGAALRALVSAAERSAARILVDDPTYAEDVAQRIVRRLLEQRSVAEILHLGTSYFAEAGRREALTALRNQQRRRELLDCAAHAAAAPPPRPDEVFAVEEFGGRIREWIANSLPPRTAEVARMAWFEHCTSEEIADRLDVAVKRVERHRKKARERFRACFPELVPEPRPRRRPS